MLTNLPVRVRHLVGDTQAHPAVVTSLESVAGGDDVVAMSNGPGRLSAGYQALAAKADRSRVDLSSGVMGLGRA
jgi:hypothetical protein